MLRRFALVCSMGLVPGVALADDVVPDNPGESYTRAFAVDLGAVASPADAIPAIVEAGRVELVTACEQTPGGAVRFLSPFASDDYADVSCADILASPVEAAGQTSATLTSEPAGERIGEARQKLTPVGPILCSLLGAIETAAFAKACGDWRGSSSQVCTVGGAYNTVAWIAACALMF